MAYRLVAIDIDDTLLTNEGKILPRVKHAIQKAAQNGVYIVLCTGRTKKGAWRFYDALNLDTLLISSGGAEVYDVHGNPVLLRPVDPQLTKEILTYAYENGLHAQVYIDGELVYREKNSFSDTYEELYGFPGIVMPDIMEQRHIVTPKVLIIAQENQIPDIRKQMEERFPTLTIIRSKATYLEFSDAQATKGAALQWIAKHYHISRDEIIAIGDAEIDISMLQYAGTGIAVANADPETKEAADMISASNQDGGVADILEKFILEA